MGTSLFARLDARDRALFARWALAPALSRGRRLRWTAVTHLGGTAFSVAAAGVPLVAAGERVRVAARLAILTLVISHLLVQAVKRTVGRPRPSRRLSHNTLVAEPDRFSFPSGHAAAAMAVAFGYAVYFPFLAPVLLLVAMAIGFSRVCLGVHYPSDVVVGQVLALGTGAALLLVM